MEEDERGSLTVCHGVESFLLELEHLIGEAHALLADDVLARHAHVVEEHLRRVRRPHAELVDLAGDLHP